MDKPSPFPGCGDCEGHACEQLRDAGADSGALLAVAAREVAAAECPFVCSDAEELAALLTDLPLGELIFLAEGVVDELPPGEANRFRLSHYCHDYRDAAGRAAFVKAVVEEGLIVVLRRPPGQAR